MCLIWIPERGEIIDLNCCKLVPIALILIRTGSYLSERNILIINSKSFASGNIIYSSLSLKQLAADLL